MSVRRPVLVNGQWKHGVNDWGADRDSYWLLALELARIALADRGSRCVACGGFLWNRRSGRLYCDETCRRRHGRRKERYRETLRTQGKPCVFCGDDLD